LVNFYFDKLFINESIFMIKKLLGIVVLGIFFTNIFILYNPVNAFETRFIYIACINDNKNDAPEFYHIDLQEKKIKSIIKGIDMHNYSISKNEDRYLVAEWGGVLRIGFNRYTGELMKSKKVNAKGEVSKDGNWRREYFSTKWECKKMKKRF